VADVENELLAWASEALELRHGEADDPQGKVSLPEFELGQPAAVDMLARVRVRLDRVEELQSKARRAKGRVMRMREEADFEASLKYDEEMANGKNRWREYVTADEKRADAMLASLSEKRQAHQLKRLESVATETLDVIGQCYWGLGKLREDILQILRLHNNFLTTEETLT